MINIMNKIQADKGNEDYIGRWGTTYKGLLKETFLEKWQSQVKGKSHVNIWEKKVESTSAAMLCVHMSNPWMNNEAKLAGVWSTRDEITGNTAVGMITGPK